jgi:uncharacterized membrane protein
MRMAKFVFTRDWFFTVIPILLIIVLVLYAFVTFYLVITVASMVMAEYNLKNLTTLASCIVTFLLSIILLYMFMHEEFRGE